MILSKVLSKYQITLPKEVVKRLHIEKGDVLKCEVQGHQVTLTPVVVEESYSEDELKKFDRLYNHPSNRGKVYKNTQEAVDHLKRLRRPK